VTKEPQVIKGLCEVRVKVMKTSSLGGRPVGYGGGVTMHLLPLLGEQMHSNRGKGAGKTKCGSQP